MRVEVWEGTCCRLKQQIMSLCECFRDSFLFSAKLGASGVHFIENDKLAIVSNENFTRIIGYGKPQLFGKFRNAKNNLNLQSKFNPIIHIFTIVDCWEIEKILTSIFYSTIHIPFDFSLFHRNAFNMQIPQRAHLHICAFTPEPGDCSMPNKLPTHSRWNRFLLIRIYPIHPLNYFSSLSPSPSFINFIFEMCDFSPLAYARVALANKRYCRTGVCYLFFYTDTGR